MKTMLRIYFREHLQEVDGKKLRTDRQGRKYIEFPIGMSDLAHKNGLEFAQVYLEQGSTGFVSLMEYLDSDAYPNAIIGHIDGRAKYGNQQDVFTRVIPGHNAPVLEVLHYGRMERVLDLRDSFFSGGRQIDNGLLQIKRVGDVNYSTFWIDGDQK